jgi:opacity protein-like surface antigen
MGFADGEWGIDVQAAFVIVPGLEARLGYARHNDYHSYAVPVPPATSGTSTAINGDVDQLNFWIAYETGNLTLAAEYSDYDWNGDDGRAWMLLANYWFNNRIGGTLRFSAENFDKFDTWKFSVGPSIRITENLLTRFEYSYAQSDIYNTGVEKSNLDVQMLLAEGIFTF